MLERLEVHSLGIIDTVTLELDPGVITLTGETGAGKSLLVESLKLLSGQRAQADMVRSGEDRLRVQAWFTMPSGSPLEALFDELGIPWQGSVVIRREVVSGGRSRCWLNDTPVTASTLQSIVPHLLAIHGQHEQYGLADPAVQRQMVDEFGGHEETLASVRTEYRRWAEAAGRLGELRSARASRRDRLDVISFQLAEIDAVAPQPGEDSEMLQRRDVLRHAARLLELSQGLLGRLSDSDTAAVDALARAERELAEMQACGLPLAAASERLAEAGVLVEDVVNEVQRLTEGIEQNPAELESVESRLHRLEQLQLKYGSPLEAVLVHRERIVEERRELERVEHRVREAESAAEAALAAYARAAEELDRARSDAGASLAQAVQLVLARVNMAGTELAFAWREIADDRSPLVRQGRRVAFDEHGVEQCDLLIAPNPGEQLRPMARIASGGELSRLHLALRTALRSRRGGKGLTLLFDEVDSGLGGATAAALARLLEDLAVHDQVLVVTHLPQVAARAGSQFRVEKVMQRGRAVTRVRRLTEEDRELEIARMLAGEELSGSARAHARALLGDR